MIVVAVVLWAALAASCVLAVIGVQRRSGATLVAAGVLGLGFSGAAVLSIGRFVVLLPLLELAIGAGYLSKAPRGMLWVLAGVAIALYVAQLATLL